MYVFDCALMKYPNTGLFAFSDNLARCLARHAEEQKEKMGAGAPPVAGIENSGHPAGRLTRR